MRLVVAQRTLMVDPNSGTTTYGYDANGQTMSVVSEAGTITMGYDVLGRMLTRTSTDPGSNASSHATWTYDPTGHLGALGSTTSSTRIGGVDYTTTSTGTYDSWHRPLTSTVMLPANTSLGDLAGYSSTTSVTYDGIGQISGTSLPAVGGLPAETVTTGYRRSGQAETLTVNGAGVTTPIVTSTSIGSTGLLTSRSYGNGVTRNITWDQVWRTPVTISASFGYVDGQTPKTAYLQRDTLTRDTVGRVTGINDAVASSTQCYTYDGFNRLNAAWTTGSTCGAAPVASDTFWRVDATSYATTWDYSGSGRILSIVNLATGGTSATSTFTYDDASHPNAATQVTTGAVTDLFVYDDAGRQTTRTIDTTTTDLTWDVLSNLVETDGAGGHLLYVYDASGQRVAKVTLDPDPETGPGGAATAYLGATEVTDPNTATTSTGDLTATRFYTFGGSTVAVRQATQSSSTLSLLLGDVQGSAQVMMQATLNSGGAMVPAATTDPITRSVYTPYGSTRGTDSLTIDHGWLNQASDGTSTGGGTGLIYLNARYYDPVLARFLSPDPLMNLSDPRTLDPYRYADNNPIMFMDPSGLFSWGDLGHLLEGVGNAVVSLTGYAYDHSVALITDPVRFGQAWWGDVQRVTGAIRADGVWAGLNETYNPVYMFLEAEDGAINAAAEGDWEGVGENWVNATISGTVTFVLADVAAPKGKPSARSSQTTPKPAVATKPGADAVSQVTRNRMAGNMFRDTAADHLQSELGFEIAGKEVPVKTPLGTRVIDILAKRNGGLVNFETKYGNSWYTTAQRAKDWWLSNVGVDLGSGKPTKIPTVVIRGPLP